MEESNLIREQVKEYYSKDLTCRNDFKAGASCIDVGGLPPHIAEILPLIHPEVSSKFYGCSIVLPDGLENAKILDLGSGSGHDCFILSKLVGPNGFVTGVDMTKEQLDLAEQYIEYHTKLFGYENANVAFKLGYIEDLADAGIEPNAYDVIISNCVVNLSTDKTAVLQQAFNVLKEGGELFFSDLYIDRQLPDEIKQDKVLWGEGLTGALWWQDLHKIATAVGFYRPLLVAAQNFPVQSETLRNAVGNAKFVSATYRLFKVTTSLSNSKPIEVTYNGTISHCTEKLVFDNAHVFEVNKPKVISGEIAHVIQSSRFRNAFTIKPHPTENKNANLSEPENPFTLANGTMSCKKLKCANKTEN